MKAVGDSDSSAGTKLMAKSARSGERGVALTLMPLTGSPSRSRISEMYFRAFSVMVSLEALQDDLSVSGCPCVCPRTLDWDREERVGNSVCIRWMVDVGLF